MTEFTSGMEGVSESLCDFMGREIIFRPVATDRKNERRLKAILGEVSQTPVNQFDGHGRQYEMTATLLFGNQLYASEIGQGSGVVIDDVEWNLEEVTDRSRVAVTARLVRYERIESSVQTHRVDRFA